MAPKNKKRPRSRENNDVSHGEREVRHSDSIGGTSTRNDNKHQQRKASGRHVKKKARTTSVGVNNDRRKLALSGITVAVSTLKSTVCCDKGDDTDVVNNDIQSSSSSDSNNYNIDRMLSSYQDVCNVCEELGATVTGQVCKRVSLLISTRSAAQQATQRVRKAIKKGKTIVSVQWLHECRSQNKFVNIDDKYRLESVVLDAMKHRQAAQSDRPEQDPNDRTKKDESNVVIETETKDDGGERIIDLGCCCVCHELGTEDDCEWCVACPIRLQRRVTSNDKHVSTT